MRSLFMLLVALLVQLILGCGVLVILFDAPVFSILSLMLTVLFTSALLLVVGVEFLGLTYVLIYAGAISVLFLFSVIILDLSRPLDRVSSRNHFMQVLGGLLIMLTIIELGSSLYSGSSHPPVAGTDARLVDVPHVRTDFAALASLLYGRYSVPLLILAFILLVALIAAIVSTKVFRAKVSRRRVLPPEYHLDKRDE